MPQMRLDLYLPSQLVFHLTISILQTILNSTFSTFTNLIFTNLVSNISHKHLGFLELGLEEDFESHNVLALLLTGKIHIPKFTFS